MSDSTLKGGCLCGAIRYTVEMTPLGAGHCFCRDCQYTTGGGPATAFVVVESALEITEGEPKCYSSETHTGGTAQRLFCGECGTPLFGKKTSSPGTVAIMAGSLDDPNEVKPIAISWADSAPNWAHLSPDLRRFPKDIDL